MATIEEVTALLKEAETAYHELAIGTSARVVVHQNGSRVEYTPASRTGIKTYIAELKQALATMGATSNAAIAPRPMRVWF